MNGSITKKSTRMTFPLLSLLAIVALVLTACAPSVSVTSTPSDTIDVASNPSLGQILVNGQGMTLYAFTKDTPDQSNCDAKCLANWPALVSSGSPKLGPGVDASLIGTATLPSGEKIITYDHMPLYTFIKDTQPGQVNGEDVGSVWYTVSPDGKLVQAASSPTPAATATPVIATPTPSLGGAFTEPTINVATDSKLGQILVDGKGMTLYIFTNDGPDQSKCNAKCLANWPPLLTQGNPVLGPGVDASLIGSATLADGTTIVTYNHMPLYYFIKDTKPGDISGVGVGSVWYLVSPAGAIVGQ